MPFLASFPEQSRVCQIIEQTFKQHARPASFGWWPEFDFPWSASDCKFEWNPPLGSFNVLQKKLKLGNRLAKAARATV